MEDSSSDEEEKTDSNINKTNSNKKLNP